MKIEERTVYITDDGEVFYEKDKAIKHEVTTKLYNMLCEDSNYYDRIDTDDAADWIVDNAETVIKILKQLEDE